MPDLSLAELVVLAILDEAPAHGFAIAALTGADGELGRVWQIPRPIVYRSLPRLQQARLARARAAEPGRGPQRQPYVVTAAGRRVVADWLQTPVTHVREVRSHLLLKLALLHRRDADPTALLLAQREALAPIARALDSGRQATGFDATLATWRRTNAAGTVAFLDELLKG